MKKLQKSQSNLSPIDRMKAEAIETVFIGIIANLVWETKEIEK
jgi:hypothetical protein